ncbi:MAG: pseudouridine-5'-phosphate glycosidase, partial [Egibacteraceae bacterium]
IVVCAGVKSILDVGATLERLETLGVTVVGYRTRRFPGFSPTDGGFDLAWSAESPQAVAEIARARAALDTTRQAIVVAQPLPEELQLDPAAHDAALAEGLALAAESGISGQGTTPFLLDHLAAATGGASVEANVALVRRNARLAAQIAVALGAG